MKKILIILILIISAFFRLGGIYPGYPPYHSDEGMSYSSASSMIKNKDMDPRRYDYPALVPTINYFIFKGFFMPLYWVNYYLSNIQTISTGLIKFPLDKATYKAVLQSRILGEREENALLWGRIVTAIFGIGIVGLTYILGKKLFSVPVGIFAAFLVGTNYRMVLNSHLGLPDIYNAFFILLSVILSFNIIKKPTRLNYLFAGVALGLSVSTKFQIFSYFPFFVCHFLTINDSWNFRNIIKKIINRKLLLTLIVSAAVFILINPYLFINYHDFIYQITDVSMKYSTGKNYWDLFGIFYLYKIGIGQLLTIFFIIGTFILLFSKSKNFFILFSFLIPFFIVTNYVTNGGFYTRNYVSITPLLLLVASFCILFLVERVISKNKIKKLLLWLITMLVIFLASKQNIENSLVVASEYKNTWNYKVAEIETNKAIPEDVVVALHPSVLIRQSQKRIPYEIDYSFSLDEFRDAGATYAVANLDWATNGFYWWMTTGNSVKKYFNKPTAILEETYPALALRELSDYSIFNVVNPWQAPDSNFIGAAIPSYVVSNKKLQLDYKFEKDTEGWNKVDGFDQPLDNLEWDKDGGFLEIGQNTQSSPVLHWESKGIPTQAKKGYFITAKMKTDADVGDLKKDGFIRVDFYNTGRKVATRLSSRMSKKSQILQMSVVVPEDAMEMKIGFQVYDNSLGTFRLEEITISSADIIERLPVKTEKYNIPTDILFPNSHGGL